LARPGIGDDFLTTERAQNVEQWGDVVKSSLHDLLVGEKDLDVVDDLDVAVSDLADRHRERPAREEWVLPELVVLKKLRLLWTERDARAQREGDAFVTAHHPLLVGLASIDDELHRCEFSESTDDHGYWDGRLPDHIARSGKAQRRSSKLAGSEIEIDSFGIPTDGAPPTDLPARVLIEVLQEADQRGVDQLMIQNSWFLVRIGSY
jgi:hypothetical protein